MQKKILPILRCPLSWESLSLSHEGELVTKDSSHRWKVVDGRPVLYPNLGEVKRHGEHLSNQLSEKAIQFISSSPGLVLNLSAGGTRERQPNVIELETAIFKHTDVIGDVHSLPFLDDSFDAVLAMNAFEHYRDPFTAAKEIYRVLKPGGRVLIHTAFLQPLHEPPWHFYNATKYGVLEWFTQFETTSIKVSENFNPVYALSWFCHQILQGFQSSGLLDTSTISSLTVGELAKFWRDPTLRHGLIWEQFVKLPQHVQETMAAGFEYTGVKTKR
jgi:SAM-dependent methyltransferase